MFDNKQTVLFKSPVKKTTSAVQKTKAVPIFVQAAQKKTVETRSGNGALKLSSTLDSFVDQFGKLGTYKAPRSFSEIEKDCELLWGNDPLTSVKFTHYLRTITRKVNVLGTTTDEPQKGGELKFEPIMRMIWLSQKAPEVFWKNIGLFISLGSWHDIFTMLQYDLVYNGWDNRKLDWKKFGDLILTALNNDHTNNLVKKYLPQIKARSDCKTVESQANCLIAKWICSLLFGPKDNSYNYKQYRKLKTSGNAHDWQKLISQRKFDAIEFDKIHGRALNLLVRSKFLKNQNLSDKYAKWVGDPKTTVKYTGFVHELFSNLPYSLSGLEKHTQDTINKQFATLVEKGKSEKKENQCNFIVVRDTSSSMNSTAVGTTQSCANIGKALALYFSEFLTGRFADSFIEFNSTAKMHRWVGNNALEKWYNDQCGFYGSTNFQSVIDLFVHLKNQGIDESEFPTGILCISDSEFNPTQLSNTNVEEARRKLRTVFSKEFADKFQIVLWNLQNNFYGKGSGEKFETTANDRGCYYFSGYSASVISFITGHEVMTARQLFDTAMDQQVLNMVTL
jgi:hypothetical protein